MAVVIVEYNTEDRVLKATLDGKVMKDISEVLFYNYGEQGSVDLRTYKYDEDRKLSVVTHIVGSEITTEEVSDETPMALAKLCFPSKQLD